MRGDPRVISYLEDMLEHAQLAVGFVEGIDQKSFKINVEK